jgi:lipase ATG15
LEEETRPLVAKTSPMKIHRLKDRRPSVIDPMVAAAREEGGYWALSPSAWTMDTIAGPDVTDPQTVLTFAQMAANAYVEKPDAGDWKDVNGGFNRTDDDGFGWDSDGLRGYLYIDESNSTIVIGLKGTTLAIWDGEGTTTNDKENDNLFFSCCCGQQSSGLSRQVCDCAQGTYTCNLTCLKKSLTKENRYYAAAKYLYGNVTAMYPNAEIWLSGHSLGGSIGAMIGLTYGRAVLTFQSVPDALPSNRLGLPIPPGIDPDRPGQRDYTGAYHFGNNADPIYMGTCNGATASCSYAGYALESACHTGRECVWDVVAANGTRVFVSSHRIIWLINNVIKKWTTAPECRFTPECYDCPSWKEVTGNKTTTTTSTTSTTRAQTRTSTCKTPGWWGCLDETTTTSGVTPTTTPPTTTTSTSTCKTPGWFGCNDEITTTTTTTIVTPSPTMIPTSLVSTSTSCSTPGWFGCKDPSQTTTTPSSSASTDETYTHTITAPPTTSGAPAAPTNSSSRSCTSAGWFGLHCYDPSPSTTPTVMPTRIPDHSATCIRRSWYGRCNEWGDEFKQEI